ncbi:MAG: exodeoxyribonuclease VII large subunit [Candidatus Melainabacteria bacterium]|nr:exodeoxyribonuclease VII large subunit [Candidatus Melainabacteria bacterium]
MSPRKTIQTEPRQLRLPQERYTVSELTRLIQECLASDPVLGGTVTVQGELSNLKRSSRGHVYLTLKDEQSGLAGIVWASTAQKLPFDLEEGQEVYATGTLDIYAPSGSYSLVIKKLEPVGLGALQLAFMQLKAKLEADGLFRADRKRPLPEFPTRLGIVTSSTGAVIHDMLRVIRRKNPRLDVLLAPVPVQGAGAAASIAQAIARLSQPDTGVDVLIVARGGGSFEDLFCFSEEPVVRAIATCPVPVVTGIGHEPDFGLADAAADYSCATPTAAAEHVTPDIVAWQAWLEEARADLGHLLQRQLLQMEQHLDFQTTRLLERFQASLSALELRLTHQRQALTEGIDQHLLRSEQQLQRHAGMLDAYNPLAILARGYSIATPVSPADATITPSATIMPNEGLQPIQSIAQLPPGQRFSLRVTDGVCLCEVLPP